MLHLFPNVKEMLYGHAEDGHPHENGPWIVVAVSCRVMTTEHNKEDWQG
jgi:hypothetical protein